MKPQKGTGDQSMHVWKKKEELTTIEHGRLHDLRYLQL